MDTHLIFQILSGIIVGWLAGLVVQGRGMGLVLDLIIGVLGAILGSVVVKFFHIPVPAGFWGTLGASVGGAAILVIILRLVKND